MKKLSTIVVILFAILMVACSNNRNVSPSAIQSQENETTPVATETIKPSANVSTKGTSNDTKATNDAKATHDSKADSKNNTAKDNTPIEAKKYILSGQTKVSETKKLKWDSSFINAVDAESVYKDYLKNKGKAGDIKSFALYLTQKAPINKNWKTMAKQSIKKQYGFDVTRFESIGGDNYTAYIKNNGKEVAYVTISARTGYYHG